MYKVARKLNFVLIAVCIFFSQNVLAGYYQGFVERVFSVDHAGGRVYVVLENGNGGDSTCTSSAAYWIDPSTDIGKTFISTALTAKTSGKLVWVSGDNSCHTGWPVDGAQKMTAIDLKG